VEILVLLGQLLLRWGCWPVVGSKVEQRAVQVLSNIPAVPAGRQVVPVQNSILVVPAGVQLAPVRSNPVVPAGARVA
jgi:hypothetical protein